MTVTIIAAMDRNRLIGRDNKLPWHLPEDLKHFKETTKKKALIMGRKTFESLPGILPGRMHIVVTRNDSYVTPIGQDVYRINSLKAATTLGQVVQAGIHECFVIGGSDIFEQAMTLADKMIISHIDAEFEGDSYFPEINEDVWQKVGVESKYSESHPFRVATYLRR
jgi:dihydrofolate reductase